MNMMIDDRREATYLATVRDADQFMKAAQSDQWLLWPALQIFIDFELIRFHFGRMESRFDGKTIVVTGAGQGTGTPYEYFSHTWIGLENWKRTDVKIHIRFHFKVRMSINDWIHFPDQTSCRCRGREVFSQWKKSDFIIDREYLRQKKAIIALHHWFDTTHNTLNRTSYCVFFLCPCLHRHMSSENCEAAMKIDSRSSVCDAD